MFLRSTICKRRKSTSDIDDMATGAKTYSVEDTTSSIISKVSSLITTNPLNSVSFVGRGYHESQMPKVVTRHDLLVAAENFDISQLEKAERHRRSREKRNQRSLKAVESFDSTVSV